MGGLDPHQIRRLTADEDPRAFPGKQVYINDAEQQWWDIHFIFTALQQNGLGMLKKDWLRWVRSKVEPLLPDDRVHLCVRAQGTPDHLISNVASNVAVCFLLWVSAAVSRRPSVVHACAEWLQHGAARACEAMSGSHDLQLHRGDEPASVVQTSQGGRVYGFLPALASRLRAQQLSAIQLWWQAGHSAKTLHEPWDCEGHNVHDVFRCLLYFRLDRRTQARHRMPALDAIFIRFRDELVLWQASYMDKYFLEIYCHHHDVGKPAPAQYSPAKSRGQGQRHTQVHPETVFDIITESATAYTSVAQVLAVRKSDAHTGHPLER